MEATIIILDLSQVMLSNIMVQLGNHTNAQVEESMVRHMVLNSIRAYRSKYREYGELVIATDSKNSWRKQIFPYYKANRKKSIEQSELNWREIFNCLDKIRAEIKEIFPYKVLEIDTAEADDIIATLVKNFSSSQEILILSGDKDFIQLQRFPNVKQLDPVHKKLMSHDKPLDFLKEHIIRGDRGDGIPNIISADNCLVIGERQKKVTAKRLELWMSTDVLTWEESLLRNFRRNEELIDLSLIPPELSEKILEQYNEQAGKKAGNIMNYFINNKLKLLMESINDFL